DALEDNAQVFAGREVERIPPRNEDQKRRILPTHWVQVSHRNGREAVEVPYHPDPMANELLDQATTANLIQDIGRARGVNRMEGNPLLVEVLTNVPLPCPVDEWAPLNDILPDRFEQAAV